MIQMLLTPIIAMALVAPARDTAQEELDALQGTWQVVSYERDGKPGDAKAIEGRTLVVDKGTFVDAQAGKTLGKGTLTLDPAASPRTIDALFTEGFPKGKTSKGIYERDGDTLKACAATIGKDRPTNFTAPAGSGRMLVTYRRAK